jgi:hypothetical protein
MTPPRRASALKSVDVTGTDIVGQGFRPNSDHRPTEYAKIWEGAREAPAPRMPPTRTIPLPTQPRLPTNTRTKAPAARRRRAHHKEPPLGIPKSQPSPSPSGERTARAQSADPTAARTHHRHLPPPTPPSKLQRVELRTDLREQESPRPTN